MVATWICTRCGVETPPEQAAAHTQRHGSDDHIFSLTAQEQCRRLHLSLKEVSAALRKPHRERLAKGHGVYVPGGRTRHFLRVGQRRNGFLVITDPGNRTVLSVKRHRKYRSDQGFGMVEAVIAMAVSFIVITGLFAVMLSSARMMTSQVNYQKGEDASDSAVVLLTSAWKGADYATALVTPDRALFRTDSDDVEWTCHEFTFTGTSLFHKTWTATAFTTTPFTSRGVLTDVEEGSFALDGSLLYGAWVIKHDPQTPAVKSERVYEAQEFTAPSVSVSPAPSPVVPTPSPEPVVAPCGP